MRPRRRRSKKPWHFDDYDERDYILDKGGDSYDSDRVSLGQISNHSNRSNCSNYSNRVGHGDPSNQTVTLCPKNAQLQIKISGNISINFIGADGTQQGMLR